MASDKPGKLRLGHLHRSQHRSRNHDSAHAEADSGKRNIPAHPLIPHGEPEIITDDAGLASLIEHLRSAGSFAYDSEFIGELTYVPKLCLIQVASPQRVALIDPLADVNLQPFWELLCDPAVEKVVHAGQQDVEPVVRHLGRSPANVFDTQIAAGFIGMPYPVSLSKLVQEISGAKLGKGLTFTHWDQRPLSAMQLRYAADDVRYLPLVRTEIGKKLEALGHVAWAREECDAMCDVKLYQFDPATQYQRVRGATSLTPQGLAILRELTIWRDALAREHDVPPRAFLKDEILIDLSRNPIKSLEKLSRVRGLPRPIEAAHGTEILAVTQKGLSTPPTDLPAQRETEQSPTERFRTDALWAAAQCLAIGQSIDPNLVTSRQEIADLSRAIASNNIDPANLHLLQGWRAQAIGNPLLAMARGEQSLRVQWTNDALKANVET